MGDIGHASLCKLRECLGLDLKIVLAFYGDRGYPFLRSLELSVGSIGLVG